MLALCFKLRYVLLSAKGYHSVLSSKQRSSQYHLCFEKLTVNILHSIARGFSCRTNHFNTDPVVAVIIIIYSVVI